MKTISVIPIGIVRSTRKEVCDDHWDKENSYIELDAATYGPEALMGLAEFSHVEVVFHMNRVNPEKIENSARHPRNNPDWPIIGIFGQRGKNRPNQIGTTICRIEKIDGTRLHVKRLDAVDGTPVLDLKPWVREFGPRGDVFQPKWISELMKEYWSS